MTPIKAIDLCSRCGEMKINNAGFMVTFNLCDGFYLGRFIVCDECFRELLMGFSDKAERASISLRLISRGEGNRE